MVVRMVACFAFSASCCERSDLLIRRSHVCVIHGHIFASMMSRLSGSAVFDQFLGEPLSQPLAFSMPRLAVTRSNRGGRVPIVFTHVTCVSFKRDEIRCWQLLGCRPQSSENTNNLLFAFVVTWVDVLRGAVKCLNSFSGFLEMLLGRNSRLVKQSELSCCAGRTHFKYIKSRSFVLIICECLCQFVREARF